jgi:hypothetical protein
LLQELFYFRAFLLGAIAPCEFCDPFPDIGGDRGGRPAGNFRAAAFEELQQDFEIVIHEEKSGERKTGLRKSYS